MWQIHIINAQLFERLYVWMVHQIKSNDRTLWKVSQFLLMQKKVYGLMALMCFDTIYCIFAGGHKLFAKNHCVECGLNVLCCWEEFYVGFCLFVFLCRNH